MSSPYFLVPALPADDVYTLDGPEGHHAATVQRLYPGGVADYLERFTASLDATIQSGFLLAADREEILELAAATFPSEDDLRAAGLRASD